MSITIPVHLISEANNSEHWRVKHKRKKRLQALVGIYWKASEFRNVKPPVTITLIRLSPRTCDYDNLVYAFKGVRDFLADKIVPGLAPGRADDTKGLEFKYAQEKSKTYGIRIEFDDK